MEFLLGGGLVGSVGVLALAVVFMYRMHRSNRGDLKDVVKVERDLNEARKTIDKHVQAVAEHDSAIQKLEDELGREKAARHVAQDALGRARAKLEKIGDATTVVEEINESLDRLGTLAGPVYAGRVLPEVPEAGTAPTPSGGDD
jgi:hypothetical protein